MKRIFSIVGSMFSVLFVLYFIGFVFMLFKWSLFIILKLFNTTLKPDSLLFDLLNIDYNYMLEIGSITFVFELFIITFSAVTTLTLKGLKIITEVKFLKINIIIQKVLIILFFPTVLVLSLNFELFSIVTAIISFSLLFKSLWKIKYD